MSVADEIERLAALKEKGVLSAQEFESQKIRLLNSTNLVRDTEAAAMKTMADGKNKGMSTLSKIIIGIVVAFAAFLIFGVVVGSTPEAKAEAHDRATIDYCWKEQSRKSLTPAEQRFTAATCEKMEQDFRNKYGVSP